MAWCLPRLLSEKFLDKLKSGEITPDKMRDMSPSERHKYFADMFGEEQGTRVNALLESKLILKDWKRGMVTWAKQTGGLKPEARRDILSRVERMESLLNPAEEKEFMQDLVNHKLGTVVPLEAAQKLTELAARASELKTKATKETMRPNDTFENFDDQMAYGMAFTDFTDYYNELQNAATKSTLLEHAKHPVETLDKTIHNVLGLTKSMLITLDNSAIGTQGMKTGLNDTANTILTKPTHQWWDNAWRSFFGMFRTWAGTDMNKMTNAEIISRPNALNGLYRKHGVALNIMEEQYPEHLGKVPILGRALRGFENAFNIFQKRNRADTFDVLVNMAKAAGKDPFTSDIEGFGKLANTLTARGSLEIGRYNFESIGDFVNLVMFAGRFMKSNLDFLTFNQLHANMSPYARQVGAIQSLKGIAVIAAFLALADALDPDSVEWNPNKTTFGGIKKGTIIYEPFKMFTPYVVLASRLLTGSYVAITGKTTQLNTGRYGQLTKYDVLVNFMAGKASPPLRILIDILRGENFRGEKPTITGEVTGVLTPIPAQTARELYNNPYVADEDKILAMIAEFLGVRTTPVKYPPRAKKGQTTQSPQPPNDKL